MPPYLTGAAECNAAFLLEILRIFSQDPTNQTMSRLLR